MRRKARIDANQNDIVGYLRGLGASVAITSTAGNGFPDLVVSLRGVNYLAEIKDPGQPPSARRLTPQQQKFHDEWQGQICILETPSDCLKMLGHNDD